MLVKSVLLVAASAERLHHRDGDQQLLRGRSEVTLPGPLAPGGCRDPLREVVRDERQDRNHDDGQHRHLPRVEHQEYQRADEEQGAAGDVGERLGEEPFHLLDVAGHPPQHVAGPSLMVEGE